MRLKLCFAAFALASAAFSPSQPQGVTRGPSMGGITEYDYANGLKVLLLPDPSSPKITVNMNILVGSRHEGYGETGMAHLLEHMNFIRSTHDREIKKELTDHGAQWNGTTYYDRTNYFETFTATDDNLKWALGLEAERMVNMRIEKQLLDTEMTVVRNEFERGENSPQRILEERVLSTMYLWHNYGKSTIGSRADIEKVPIERLAAFYQKYYQPDNAVLVIAGKFDESKTLQWVAEQIGLIPRPTRKLDETYTVEPVQDGQRMVELRRVGTNQEVMIGWHAPALAHPDSAALEVLSGIMETGGGRGGAGTGRLYKALIDNKKAISVNMDYNELHDPGYVLAAATLSKDQSLDDVKKTINETIQSVVSGAANEGRSGARKEPHCAGHGNEHVELAGRGAAVDEHDFERRLAAVLPQFRRTEEGHAGRRGAGREALFQGFEQHDRGVYPHAGSGSNGGAGRAADRLAAQDLHDFTLHFGGGIIRSDAGEH